MRVNPVSNSQYTTKNQSPNFGLKYSPQASYIIEEVILGCAKSADDMRQSMGKQIQDTKKILDSRLNDRYEIAFNPRLLYESIPNQDRLVFLCRDVYNYRVSSEPLCIAPFMRRDIELITKIRKFLNKVKEATADISPTPRP